MFQCSFLIHQTTHAHTHAPVEIAHGFRVGEDKRNVLAVFAWMRFGVWGLGFGVWGLGLGVWGLRIDSVCVCGLGPAALSSACTRIDNTRGAMATQLWAIEVGF